MLEAASGGHADRVYGETRRWYRIVTRGLKTTLNSELDLARYLRHSFVLTDPVTPDHMGSFLRMRYHTFEKGLSLPEPRPGFGQVELEALLRVLDHYERRMGADELFATVVHVLQEYEAFNLRNGVVLPELDARLDEYAARYPELDEAEVGGTVPLTRDELERSIALDFDAFVGTRHSVRNYADRPVDRDAIERAVRIAQRSPSVCNRQAGRVHVFTEPDRVQEVLSYQQGHRGFGHLVPCAMVLTADLRSYYKPGERFQGWVDGGLFTMSLIFGLHAEGLGTCCLNWNVTREDDEPMRRAAGIPNHEVVITMLAVGHVPAELRVAQSPRRPVDDVLVWGDAWAPTSTNGGVGGASGS
jgi:nitroreductase